MPPSAPQRDRVNLAVETNCDQVRFATPLLLIGEFECAVEHARFRDAGRIRNCVVAFPRRAVWIHRADQAPFVADPTVATIYSPGASYERRALSPGGDHSHWFGLPESVAREIVRDADPRAADGVDPFPIARAAVPAALLRAQRALVDSLGEPNVDHAAVEERSVDILRALFRAQSKSPSSARSPRAPTPAARALVEAAKSEIHRGLFENQSVSEIAAALGASTFHLCRTFRSVTGSTLHGYRRELRLRAALELTGAHRGQLSRLALDLGFHSHAHFTAAYRATFGEPPSRAMA